jgi:hypothetical protein
MGLALFWRVSDTGGLVQIMLFKLGTTVNLGSSIHAGLVRVEEDVVETIWEVFVEASV